MKRCWFCVVTTLIFTSAFGIAQQGDKSSSDVLNFQNGVIQNGVYSNQCLGISMPIPSRWQLAGNVVGEAGKAKRSPDGLALLMLRWHGEKAFPNVVGLTAREATGQTATAEYLVSDPARVAEYMPPLEPTRNVFAVNYGARAPSFVRTIS